MPKMREWTVLIWPHYCFTQERKVDSIILKNKIPARLNLLKGEEEEEQQKVEEGEEMEEKEEEASDALSAVA